ncbi:YdiU family protein [Sedimenticola selenatireducens]|uniref:Protein nucleotidyltransferase YdiU n=1 Tax=Sedimenticola selenatireducens TaxID=191960 RepID=A0A2N6CTB7_9GAMM|nr:YdiU family protein [Sedimenticola selenatireducens]PLX60375.1 MAG: YdiU family protein [Sedimenticola selenatireducens]
MKLSNSYAELPEHFYARIRTHPVPSPRLLAWNGSLAAHLGLEELGGDKERLAAIFSGSEPLPGGRTIAMAYAGHQFGNFVPRLGDGRAALLAEVISPRDGRRYDIQLKGSGLTPFSRNGDGKSPLGPVIREYLLSEAMHRLGVPTTRSLAAVATGEPVFRDWLEPGGVLTRVASSHIRVGTFEYFASRRDGEALQTLVDYAIQRHYPDCATDENHVNTFFSAVVAAQARLVAHWMAIGFIHGVMNTDNCAISGETLDYGPCAFLDTFHIDKVFSSIDHQGRYAYGRQAHMAQWNLARLAECLMMIEGEREDYEVRLNEFQATFEAHYFELMGRKLGLSQPDPEDRELVTAWLQLLQDRRLDYTRSFRQLALRLEADDALLFDDFETRWLQQIDRQPGGRETAAGLMTTANPLFIPRNHQVERAIHAAYEDDLSLFDELHQVLSAPFDAHPGLEHYAEPPAENEQVLATFCGT